MEFSDDANTSVIQLKGHCLVLAQEIRFVEVAMFKRDGPFIVLEMESNSNISLQNGEPINAPVFHHGVFAKKTKQKKESKP